MMGTPTRINLCKFGLGTLLTVCGVLHADFEQALGYYRDGKIAEARSKIRPLCSDSAEPRVRLLCAALSTDAETARRLGLSLVDDTNASDTIQAQAHLLVGDFLTARESYTRAVFHYSRASAILTEGLYKYASALVRAGDADSAINLLSRGPDEGPESRRKAYHLGTAFLAKKNYPEAAKAFRAAMKTSGDSWYEAAVGGAYVAAVELGHYEEAEGLKESLEKNGPFLLDRHAEKHRIEPGQKSSGHITDRTSTNKSGPYSLQVGAFASAENAASYRKELKKTFGTVRILETDRGENVLHRVRVGLFKTEEDALAFGEKQLRPRDIPFRVIAE